MKERPAIVSTGYPLTVRLIDAPKYPERLIAHTYLECIEDAKINCLEDIHPDRAREITYHVLLGGHTPSLECVHLTFAVRNISRILSHQIVRHRIGVSIGQRTQRANCEEYLGKFWDNHHYVLPPSIQKLNDRDDMAANHLKNHLLGSQQLYDYLIGKGISQDEARYIIPHCSTTSMDITISYKSLMHICSVRLCKLMQGEMVELAKALKGATVMWNSYLGKELKPICHITGKCNRNENNPNENNPKGVCEYTINGTVPPRTVKTIFDLTKYSKSS